MLSILIPVFNFDIRNLVRQLIDQCNKARIEYEILILDDASAPDFHPLNLELATLPNIQIKSNPINQGRSSSRNQLARWAHYDWLLYLDCDVQLIYDSFIQNYLTALQTNQFEVYYGSCKYVSQRPSHPLELHWMYGTHRENSNAETRSQQAYRSFHSVNFIVRKKIMLQYPFDETLLRYGHEDSLWAHLLEMNHIRIGHIDNEVLHLGLYSSKLFLRKTADAIKNLLLLEQQHKKLNTRLEQSLDQIKWILSPRLIFTLYRHFEKKIVQNLIGPHPKLLCLDLFKMGVYLRFRKKYNA